MKKTISIITSFLLLITFFNFFIFTQSYASPSSDTNLKVLVNNKLIDFPDAKPFVNTDDRTLVPVRFISETLGATVTWNGEIKQVDIMGMDKQIKVTIGQSEAYVNNEKITFDTKAIIQKDRTFVPLRFISEALGAKIEWNGESRTVFITTEDIDKQTNKDFIEPKIKLVRGNDVTGYYFYLELENHMEYRNSEDTYRFRPKCTTHEKLNFSYYKDIYGTGEWSRENLADWRDITNKVVRVVSKNHYLTAGYDNRYAPDVGDMVKFDITFKNETKGISKTYYEEVEFVDIEN